MTHLESQQPDDQPADALEHVVDDATPREESERWAIEQLAAGLTVEAVVEELVANGWTLDDAEAIGEKARRQTRHLRGALSYEDAAKAFQVGDQNVVARGTPHGQTQVFAPLAPVSVVGNGIALLRAISRLWRTRKIGRR